MTPAANTEAMNLRLAEISTLIARAVQAVVVCDGAGWHPRGQNLEVPANISLLSLAPFSPELNPTETVWDCLRQNKLCSAVWDSYDDILEVCIIAWKIQIAFDPTAPATGRVSMLKRTGISARILCVAHATRSGHRRILRVYKVGNPRSLQDGRLVVMTWRMRPNIGARKFKSARPRYTNKGKTARRCVAIAEIKA